MAIELARLEQVEPRTVWEHEAQDFTPWLLENADRLGEALGIDLEFEASEHAVGGYSLDLVGRDLTNDAVLIVENQLAGTDHSHLGQVLTYAAGTSASTIVWIATSFREEHRQALDWLNENTGEEAHFFGIELQVVKIGNSPQAPLFNVVVQPNDWQKQVRARTRAGAVSEKGALYTEFWKNFLARVRAEHPDWTRAQSRGPYNWLNMKSAINGTVFAWSFPKQGLRVELYIGGGDREENLEIFEHYRNHRHQIEAAYGEPLSWQKLPHRTACRIAAEKAGASIMDRERHEEYINWFIQAAERFRAAILTAPVPEQAPADSDGVGSDKTISSPAPSAAERS